MLNNIQDKTKSTIIKKKCPYCSKPADELNYSIDGKEKTILLKCGHSIIEDVIIGESSWRMHSLSKKEPFKFQYTTNEFGAKANYRAGYFHEQGVGKTICSLMPIVQFPEKMLPFAVICKSSLKAQWWKEILEWTGIVSQPIMTSKDTPFPEAFKGFIISYDMIKSIDWLDKLNLKYVILDECQQIKNSQSKRTQSLRNFLSGKIVKTERQKPNSNLPARRRIEIIANDLFSYHGINGRFILNFEALPNKILGLTECRANKHGIIEGKISINQSHAEHDPESEVIETILHEIAHAITPGAGHRPIWRQTALAIGSTGEEKAYCKGTVEIKDEFTAPLHIVALSGTPIKNHAGEYFPILNILHPERFNSQAQFERDFLDTYFTGYSYKIGGIKHWQTERFKELTSDFIIRFTRDEVLPDLPKIFRKNFFVELGPEVESAYKKAYIEFKEEFEGDDFGGKKSFSDQANLLAKLNRLRHITGLAKVKPLTDFVSEFLEDNERKIVLFVHHKDVGTGLFNNIKEVTNALKINPPLQLTSEMSNSQLGIQTDELFKNDKNQRIMIASTLSAGEGKNWQMCSDMIMVEHQWNPANEEQCEGRFPRPGSIAESINATYAIALGTPDEYLTEIKERKREICKKTMGNEAVTWNETSVIKELSEMLISKGGKRWNL